MIFHLIFQEFLSRTNSTTSSVGGEQSHSTIQSTLSSESRPSIIGRTNRRVSGDGRDWDSHSSVWVNIWWSWGKWVLKLHKLCCNIHLLSCSLKWLQNIQLMIIFLFLWNVWCTLKIRQYLFCTYPGFRLVAIMSMFFCVINLHEET